MALELIQVADAVAREKNIDKQMILDAMQDAIQMAARRKYGQHLDIRAKLDPVTGDVALRKVRTVVQRVMEYVSEDEVRLAIRENREPEMRLAIDRKSGKPLDENDIQITESAAQAHKKGAVIGDELSEEMPPMDFGRIAAQVAKQVIFQKVRDAEREKQYEEFKDRQGEIISGIVKRTDHRGILVDLGRGEAFLPREEMIPRESFRQNDRVRAYIYKVEQNPRGAQVFISRSHPMFMKALFNEEVPEITNGMIEVVNVARDPGFRAKIAVKSHDHNMDPVGACVGIRGVRVQAVTNELQGERIDIIQWSPDPAQFLVQSLSPAEVSKVVLDEDENRIEVVVPEDKLSLAIGRRGQNVRLASILTGWDIDIMTEQEESERREKETKSITEGFIKRLDVDENISQILMSEGFRSADELLLVSVDEIAAIEGFDEGIASELQRRAQASVDALKEEMEKKGVESELSELKGMSPDILQALVEGNITTRDDFAELATDELMEMIPSGMLSTSQAEALIMEARKHWFEGEEEASETELKTSEETLESLEGMTEELLAVLTEKEITTRDDLGELATDELLEMLPAKMLTEKKAEGMIMEARKHWFADEASTTAAHA